MARLEGCIQTYGGRWVDPFDMHPSDIFLEDIAHGLSNICRFTGHVKQFYSVAEHSCHVASLVPREHQLTALLHDSAEAFLNDLARPIKHRPEMAFYREAEDRVLATVLEKYGCPSTLPDCVKEADDAMLHNEALTLMAAGAAWANPDKASKVHLVCMQPFEAKMTFMETARHLVLQLVEG